MPKTYFQWREWYLHEGAYKNDPIKRDPRTRPPAPTKIPLTWWAHLALFLARRKASAPPPTTTDPLAFWRRKGTWVSWGMSNGQFTPEELAAWAWSKGFKWVGVEDNAPNRSKVDPARLRAALHARGIDLVIWHWATTVESAKESIDYWNPDGFTTNVEHRNGSSTWHSYTAALRQFRPRPYPFAVFTNFAGAGSMPDGTYSKGEAEAFWGQDFACITESYMVNEQGPQPSLAPENLDWTAKVQLGYPETFPAFGIYRCPVSFYDKYLSSWPAHSWYLSEYRYPA